MVKLSYILFCSILTLGLQYVTSIKLISYLSEHGLHGTVTFTQTSDQQIQINTDLNATLEYPNQVWSWYVTEFPVDYSILENRCTDSKLGRELVDLDGVYGYLLLPDNKTSELITSELTLTGKNGLFGKSLLLKNVENNARICASIVVVDKSLSKTAIAKFNSPIAGDVFFRWISTKNNQNEMLISTDLYHVRNVEKAEKRGEYTEHNWKIYITDIFDSDNDKSENDCNILQLVFDPENTGGGKAIGDVDARLGKVKVANNYNKNQVKELYRDEKLILLPSDLTGPQRRLYLVVFEIKHPDSFLACAKIRYDEAIHAKAIIQAGGIKGDITFTQTTRFQPTFLNFNLTTARGDVETRLVYSSSVSAYKIHELPIMPATTIGQTENACLSTKVTYNPLKRDSNAVPPNGLGTHDQYILGDLSGKLLGRNNVTDFLPASQELKGVYWDVFLPLQGRFSVIHRSLVIYKSTQYTTDIISEPWICGTIALYEPNYMHQKQMFTSQILFRYPTVGRILLRQPRGEPWADTIILVESLIHADGSSLNNSAEHRWAIHELPPGKDFYDWQNRCISTGGIYNPYEVDFDNKTTSDPANCNAGSIGMCRLGDLSARHGTLEIAGRKSESARVSRRLYTDTHLPLTGAHGVMGKSFVLFADHGPTARGERLACSIIGGVYRRKVVAKDWFPNGDKLTVKGKLEFYQQTEYDVTNVEVDLEGLRENSGYHIHITPIEESLEFPCEATSLYDHWNPLNVEASSSPKTYLGTPDQYEMGDLSGKFGTLDNHTLYKQDYNDTMLPLFGPRSILGRSIVIHKRVQNRRWACSTLERGYSPSEARELRAIASFHHPAGFAYGYVRMTQLIHNDGSRSDTIIELKLRHPGVNDRNITRDHNWAIYVQPVGVDAAVKTQDTRCSAGGYVWNPFYTQLADPLNTDLYRQECGPDNPLRCYVGDLSSRLGTVDIGLKRVVYTDSNLPLEGDVSAIGKSIVILSPNRQPQRYACANIEPDYDIIKYANIEKPPRFVLAQFIEDIRHVMGIPEWFLTVDSRKTKVLHNDACVQFLMHFKGPLANQMEQDFTKLLATGRLDTPSLYIPGYVNQKRKTKISYKVCGSDPNENNRKKSSRPLFNIGSYYSGAQGLSQGSLVATGILTIVAILLR